MQKFFFFALLGMISAGFFSCKNSEIKTESGNRVVIHTKNNGLKADYGQTMLINVSTYVKDSIVQSTVRDFGGPREVEIPTKDMIKGKIPAVFEALLLMTEGDSATVYQPVDSAMAKVIKPRFGDVAEVRYEVVLVDLLTPEEMEQRKQAEEKKRAEQQANAELVKARAVEVSSMLTKSLGEYKGKKLANLQKTESGLEYVILDQGAGAKVKDGDSVPTHYYGILKSNGKMFDNSFDRGMPLPFTVGQMIPGFNEGMKLLNKGGKAILFIPSGLGYGDAGAGDDIPPGSDLVFYIEMDKE
ncbi:MAG: FKBP-type peptidyl-prolyl cis-trans isomerase [Saprospiraceae bacterium]|nr:FKBP-type peptidyl-prolyl cis-trans isomerase [Saprospiraceae bacterium]